MKNNTIKIIKAAAFVVFIFYGAGVFAVNIVLTNGKTIEGQLIHEDSEEIHVQIQTEKDEISTSIIKRKDISTINYTDEEKEGQKRHGENASSNLEPEIGLFFSLGMPAGVVSNAASIGFGAGIYADFILPLSILKTMNIELKTGLYAAFSTFSGTMHTENTIGEPVSFSTNVSILPVIVYSKWGMPLESLGITPYVLLGGGVTYSKSQRTVDEASASLVAEEEKDILNSSVDGTFSAAVGMNYSSSSASPFKFMLQARYLSAVEKKSGHFIQLDMGVGYTF